MSESPIKIQILISTCNSEKLIDDTLRSIWAQNYQKESIYINIVDFASTDGTYEKLLGYDSYHLGIYRFDGNYSMRTMPAVMVKIIDHFYQKKEIAYQLLLRPGDEIYPDFLRKMASAMTANSELNPSFVVCETDVKDNLGGIIRYRNLYDTERVINGKTELAEYLDRGYRQNVVCLGGKILKQKYRRCSAENERIWWSKLLFAGHERNVVYIPEHLACIRERYYEDELEEILLRWEMIIIMLRFYEANYGRQLDSTLQSKAEKGIAEYAIWRSYLLWQKDDGKQARECFEIAGVIEPGIKEKEIYSYIEDLLNHSVSEHVKKIEEYFNHD